jgi:hypothetical protein
VDRCGRRHRRGGAAAAQELGTSELLAACKSPCERPRARPRAAISMCFFDASRWPPSRLAHSRATCAAILPRKINGGGSYAFEVHPEFEVLSIKALVEDASGLPIDEQRILYKGRVMKDEDTLESAGMLACRLLAVFPSLVAAVARMIYS